MIAPPHVPLIKQWRRQVPRRRRDIQHRRPLGVLGYLTNGPTLDGMIEVEKLVLVVLYDEPVHGGPLCLRLAGVSGKPVPWGVCWGGRAGSKFFKDLRLQPAPQAQGRRMNADDTELLQLGLQLERQLQRHLRNRWLPVNRQPELPPVWAGFRRPDARDIQGDGPELAAACRQRRKSPKQLLASTKRDYHGLVLYPLEWVSHRWKQAVAVLADLERFPKWQVFSLKEFPAELQGYRGAAQYDFFTSRFRSDRKPRRRPRQRSRLATTATA